MFNAQNSWSETPEHSLMLALTKHMNNNEFLRISKDTQKSELNCSNEIPSRESCKIPYLRP